MRRKRKAFVSYGDWCDGCEVWINRGVALQGPAESATNPPLSKRFVFVCMACARHIAKALQCVGKEGREAP